jgi:hypothetical protein
LQRRKIGSCVIGDLRSGCRMSGPYIGSALHIGTARRLFASV